MSMDLPEEFRELNSTQRDLLYSLALDGPANGNELYQRLGGVMGVTNRSSPYVKLNQLAEKGLVEIGERDKRENEYRLTDDGAALVDRVRAVLG